MRTLACAVILTFAVVGVAVGEEFLAVITKVDAAKGAIEYKKYSGKGKEKKLEDTVYKANLAKGALITQDSRTELENKDGKITFALEEVPGGLTNEMFSKGKGVYARLTTADADDKAKGIKKGDVARIHTGWGLSLRKTDK